MKRQVKCPICGRRLFDITDEPKGKIEIKCTQCKQISEIELEEIVQYKAV